MYSRTYRLVDNVKCVHNRRCTKEVMIKKKKNELFGSRCHFIIFRRLCAKILNILESQNLLESQNFEN